MAKLLKFVIYSNLLISICALAFVHSGVQLLHAEGVSIRAQVLVFSATFLIYNLNIFLVHLIRNKKAGEGEKMAWFRTHRHTMTVLISLNALGLLWAFPYHSWQESLFFIHLGIISVLYNVPDKYAQSKFRSARSVPLLKIFLIAYVWASIGAIYPALLKDAGPGSALLLFGLFFVFIVAITLPFDIRDYYGDKRVRLLTVPGLLGIRATKVMGVVLLFLYAVGLALFFQQILAAGLLFVLASLLIVNASSKSPDWYFTGIIDSLLLLHFLLVF